MQRMWFALHWFLSDVLSGNALKRIEAVCESGSGRGVYINMTFYHVSYSDNIDE